MFGFDILPTFILLVEKTVMQLLTLSESRENKNSVGASSSSRKFDDIDPVDIPLPDMNQYLNPDSKDFTENQLDSPVSLSNSQYPVPKPRKNAASGTARPMFPNYMPILSGNPSQIEPSEVSDGFHENELYVSDDDISEQLDSVRCIDRIGRNENVDDKNIGKRAQQSFSKNSLKNKSRGNQSFNDNNLEQKQVNIHNGKRTTSPHTFEHQFNFPANQYFVGQARYFSNLTSTPFSHQFVQTQGNIPPGQYHRPIQHSAFRPPMPCHPTMPCHVNSTSSMTCSNKETNMSAHPATVETDVTAFKNPLSATFETNNTKMRNHPTQATSITPVNEKGLSHSMPITSTRADHPEEETNVTASVRNYNNAKPFLPTQASKEPNHPSSANGTKGPNNPIPTTIAHGKRGFNRARPITPAHGIKEPSCPTTSSVTHGSKLTNHSPRAVPETSPIHQPNLNKGHRQSTPANVTKVPNHSNPPNSRNNGKEYNDVVRGNGNHQSFKQGKFKV